MFNQKDLSSPYPMNVLPFVEALQKSGRQVLRSRYAIRSRHHVSIFPLQFDLIPPVVVIVSLKVLGHGLGNSMTLLRAII